MSNYTDARAKLDNALNFVVPDGPEWIKINAAIAALDQAEVAEIEREFINATRRLDDAVAKLKSILVGLAPNVASQFLTEVRGALQLIMPVVQNVDALLSGEPASALPGMAESNKPSFPTAAEPSVPPVREFSRDIAEQPAAGTTGADAVDAMIKDILRREGGFVDHPNDAAVAIPFRFEANAAMALFLHGLDGVGKEVVEDAKEVLAGSPDDHILFGQGGNDALWFEQRGGGEKHFLEVHGLEAIGVDACHLGEIARHGGEDINLGDGHGCKSHDALGQIRALISHRSFQLLHPEFQGRQRVLDFMSDLHGHGAPSPLTFRLCQLFGLLLQRTEKEVVLPDEIANGVLALVLNGFLSRLQVELAQSFTQGRQRAHNAVR